jgi:hypothetical protein
VYRLNLVHFKDDLSDPEHFFCKSFVRFYKVYCAILLLKHLPYRKFHSFKYEENVKLVGPKYILNHYIEKNIMDKSCRCPLRHM